jgi:NAD(P)-dependent dehydrogenase (short-subunit alcohol dehydrogenase family)
MTTSAGGVLILRISSSTAFVPRAAARVQESTDARRRRLLCAEAEIPRLLLDVYNGTKAFIDTFSFALRNESKETEVTVTCLMPGATKTEFFERADIGYQSGCFREMRSCGGGQERV